MWFSSDTLQILSRELTEQSGREERVRLLEKMRRAENNELVTGTGLMSLKKTKPEYFLSTEMSQRYGTHPGRERVVSGGFREILNVWSSDASKESLQELSSDHEEADTRIVLHAIDAAVKVITKLMCCAMTQMFSSSSWRTDKISVKKFGCSLVHPEQRDTFQSTKSHCPRRRGGCC